MNIALPKLRLFASLGFITASLAACSASGSDDGRADDGTCAWEPERDVSVVVPFDPGGGSDMFGRAVAAGLEEVRPDISVTVENRPGGSGTIGYTYFYEQSGDPHFLLGAENAIVSLPLRHDELPFEAESWTPIGNLVEDTIFLVAHSDSKWTSFEDFLEAARQADADGNPLSVAQPAADSVEATALESVLEEEDVDIELVTFDGSAGSTAALLAGDIHATLVNPAEIVGQVESGDFVPLVSNSPSTLGGVYEGVPSYEDLGYEPEGAFAQFRGVIAPPDVTECAQEYWVEALQDWVETDSYQEYVDSTTVSASQIWGKDWSPYLKDAEAGYQEIIDDQAGS